MQIPLCRSRSSEERSSKRPVGTGVCPSTGSRLQRGFRTVFAAIGFLVLASAAAAQEPGLPTDQGVESIPLRVRDLTLPNALVLGLIPVPPGTVGKGKLALELTYSHANYFQISGNVKGYLAERNETRPLNAVDAEAILGLEGDAFYIDGEFGLANLAIHYGLGERLDVFAIQPYFQFTGGCLDSIIYDFHDTFGIDQAGRDLVAQDQFQILLKHDDDQFVFLDRPSSGGFGDPILGLRYMLPNKPAGWEIGFEVAVKLPFADERKFLSSGSIDYGLQIALARRWRKNAVVLNASYVFTGEFKLTPGFRASDLPAVNLSYLRRIGSRTTAVIQLMTAGSIFSDVTDSSLSEIEFQTTFGVKWKMGKGDFGVALTENIFNYANTPDIGIHLTYGVIIDEFLQ